MKDEEAVYEPSSSEVYCVPILISHAVERLSGGTITPSVQQLAKVLGVRVREGDPNPWRLGVAPSDFDSGVTMRAAAEALPEWLKSVGSDVKVEYHPYASLPWGDGEMFAEDLLGRPDIFLAAALDWKEAVGETGTSLHVVEVTRYRGRVARVVDPSQAGSPSFSISIQQFESAIRSANGGFLVLRG